MQVRILFLAWLNLCSVALAAQCKWCQCGGVYWKGGTDCVKGTTCQCQSPCEAFLSSFLPTQKRRVRKAKGTDEIYTDYSQCLPPEQSLSKQTCSLDNSTSPASSPNQPITPAGGDTSSSSTPTFQAPKSSSSASADGSETQQANPTGTPAIDTLSPSMSSFRETGVNQYKIKDQEAAGQPAKLAGDSHGGDDECDAEYGPINDAFYSSDNKPSEIGSSPASNPTGNPPGSPAGNNQPLLPGFSGQNTNERPDGDPNRPKVPTLAGLPAQPEQTGAGAGASNSTFIPGGRKGIASTTVRSSSRLLHSPKADISSQSYSGLASGPGACGCQGSWQAPGYGTLMTAAGSGQIFGTSSYCGTGCGRCFQLTNTGNPLKCGGQGVGGKKGDKIMVMITNLCPQQGNEQWCTVPENLCKGPDGKGYGAHFDMAVPDAFTGGPNNWGE